MKRIDLEAHFSTKEYRDYLRSIKYPISAIADKVESVSCDLGEGRLKVMDDASIDIHVLSIGMPSLQELEVSDAVFWSRKINNTLSVAVKKYPDRFVGLACLAAQSPSEAAEELDRAVTELGLKGACLLSHVKGEYFDDKKYRVIFKRAAKLDVPILFHPQTPSSNMLEAYGGYGSVLSGAPLGYGAEVALLAMRLICSGLFDEYPSLQVILGHMGEGLPFWIPRLDGAFRTRVGSDAKEGPRNEKRPSEYLKTNFTITTSGMFFNLLLCAPI